MNKKITFLTPVALIFLLTFNCLHAQVVAGWDFSGQSSYGTSPLTASTTGSNVTVGQLTKGSGILGGGSAASRAWGAGTSTTWGSYTTAAQSISGNAFATFTIKANTGYTLSLSAISQLDYRISGSGPPNVTLQYQINAGAFTDIATYTGLSTSSSGGSIGSTSLSGISALQNLPSTTTVTFRIVPYGGSNGGTWYLYDKGNSTANDLVVTGTVGGTGPAISTTGTLAAVNTTYGTASTPVTSFSVSGSNMTAGITITPPAGYEVSTSSTFASNVGDNASPITVGSSGTISSTTIYVRLKATATVAGSPYTGNIVCSSSGATSQNVATASSTVSKAPLTITGLTGDNKVYTSTTAATFTGTAAYSGLVNGESFVVTGSPSASFVTATVGNDKTINVTGYTAPNNNYSLTQPTLTGNITPATLTLSSPAAANKLYDGTTAATISGTLSGILGSDAVTLNGTGTFASPNVGTGIAVTSTSTLGGAQGGNYTLTQPTGLTANISKGNQTISGLAATDSRVYGAAYALSATASSGLTVSYTSSNPAVATVSGNTVTTTGAGTTTITAIQAGDANWNAATNATQTLTVTPKALTITGLTADNKVYTATNAATLSGTPSLNGIVGSDVVTLGGSPTATFASINVANGITVNVTGYTLSGAQAGNYTLTQPTLSANITKATLTITGAAAANKVYDATTAATITGTLSGIIGSDVVTLNGTGTFASANVGNGIAVTGTCTLSGAQAGNYQVTQPTGLSANITKADQTITFGALANKTTASADYSPGATSATSGINPITYASSNTSVATIVGSNIHIVGAGTTNITASQAGSANYNAAADVTQGLLVTSVPATPAAGDIVFTQVDATSDNFEFLTLRRLDLSGLEFTDNGICSSDLFRMNETDAFTTTNISRLTGVPGGTFIRLYINNQGSSTNISTNALAQTAANTGLVMFNNNDGGLSASGEEVICYTGTAHGAANCGGSGTNTYISGINWNDGGWNSGSTASDDSKAPGTATDWAFGTSAGIKFTGSLVQNTSTLAGSTTSGIRNSANWANYTASSSTNTADITLKDIKFDQPDYATGTIGFTDLTSTSISVDISGLSFSNEVSNLTRYMVMVRENSAADAPVDRYTGYGTISGNFSTTATVVKTITGQTATNLAGTPTTGVGQVVYFDYAKSPSITITNLTAGSSRYVSVYAVNGNGYTANFGTPKTQFTAVCSSPDALAFGTQPANVVQDATMSSFTVRAICTAGNQVAAGLNTGSITISSTNGCGITGTLTKPIVNGVATFNDIVITRSVQTAITFTATSSGLTSATSSAFNVSAPAGTPTVTNIKNENFEGATNWSYTVGTPTYTGSGGGTDVTGIKNISGNNVLSKSYSINNATDEKKSTTVITFSNVTGLTTYDVVKFSFQLASLGTGSGAGVDGGDDLKMETNVNGAGWTTLLNYNGFSDFLFSLASTPVTSLSYNANALYDHASSKSAFAVTLPSGVSSFQFRITATNNRTNENWSIDNILLVGTTYGTGVTKDLPTATAGSGINSCPSSSNTISVATTNTFGTVTYLWSPNSNINDNTIINPVVTPSSSQTYTVTVTDGDGCTATSSIDINIPHGTAGVWTGLQSDDWFDCRNWGDAVVPDATVDVSVSSGVPFSAKVDASSNYASPFSYVANCNSLVINGSEVNLEGSASNVLNVNGNLTLNSGGTLDISDGTAGTPDGVLYLKGNWVNNATESDFIQGDSKIVFNGTADQSIFIANGDTEVFNNLEVNKASGKLILSNNVHIENVLTLTAGIIKTAAWPNGLLCMLDTARISSPANAGLATNVGTESSYVSGPMAWVMDNNANVERTFPVGNDTLYGPVGVAPRNTTSKRFTVQYFGSAPANRNNFNTTDFSDICGLEYWDVNCNLNAINQDDNAKVTLYWRSHTGISASSSLRQTIRVAHYCDKGAGTRWEREGNFDANGSPNYGTQSWGSVTGDWVTTFSPFTFGSSLDEALPVTVLYLEAKGINNTYIEVDWATTTEINNSHFIVERSTDGNTWVDLGRVEGNGNAITESDYTFNDYNVTAGVNYYYRLRQVDYNGAYTHTDVVTAEIYKTTVFTIGNLMPNPSNGNAYFSINTSNAAEIDVNVFDALGRAVILHNRYQLVSGDNRLALNLNSLSAGTYTVTVDKSDERLARKLVIIK